MKRILVISDIGLWVTLNRHYAGSTSVRVLEVPALDSGIRLAQVELPDLIVCRGDESPSALDDLEESFREARLDGQQILYVCDQSDSKRKLGAKRAICTPEELPGWVSRFVAGGTKSAGAARVFLLAHYERATSLPGEVARGFVNLLEIQRRSLLLEANLPLDTGDHLSLTFYLPRSPDNRDRPGDRVQIALECDIGRCVDSNKLLYHAMVSDIDPKSDAPLRRFIDTQANTEASS